MNDWLGNSPEVNAAAGARLRSNHGVPFEQIRGTNLDPRAKEKVERLLRTVLTLVELLQRKNTSIKKLREMIFGKRTERHQARKAEGREKVDESEKSDDGRPKAAGDKDARAEPRAIEGVLIRDNGTRQLPGPVRIEGATSRATVGR